LGSYPAITPAMATFGIIGLQEFLSQPCSWGPVVVLLGETLGWAKGM